MRRCSMWLALLSLAVGQRAYAQEMTQDRAPRFLLASAPAKVVPVDVRRTPVLGRRLVLDLAGATLKEALVAIVAQSGLDLYYSDDVVPLDRRVHLVAGAITLAAALTDVLFDTGVDVVFRPNGRAALVRRGTLPQGGTITGRVTDARTESGVAGVRVFLERTRWGTTTDNAGRYRLAEVVPGSYTLVARRIGYKPATQAVTVEDEREVVVDVVLEPAPSMLNEVVVTATGEQRLLELGHVVGRINADSVAREAPVSNVSELLTARVPGLQVFQDQGTVGGRVNLRVRGPNSISLSNQPIVVIDGIRYATGLRPNPFGDGNASDTEPSSPLNDININDIESIEVTKGPSAATLYGTDAANGVVVITTKRGRPGPARWNAYARSTMSEIPARRAPDLYWGWGTVNGIPSNPTTSCTLARLASGACTQQDSITTLPNPLNAPQYTIYGNKPGWEYGINVAGGAQELRYYFSADFVEATGPVQMPPAIVEQIKEQRGLRDLPKEWREPNALSKVNLRSNLNVVLGRTADFTLSTGYVRNDTRAVARSGGFIYDEAFTATPATADSPYRPNSGSNPAYAFARTTTEHTERLVSSLSARWAPVPWLATRATVGLDLTNAHQFGLVRPGDQPTGSNSAGAVDDSRATQRATTVDLGATATAKRGIFTARTAVGAEYVRNLSTALGSSGRGLSQGASVVQAALTVETRQSHSETVVFGGYVEQMIGINERLFVSGAFRVDGASSFGRDYSVAVYPKASASWLVSEEPFMPRLPGLEELRLRYAFGHSGKQPLGGALPTFAPGQVDLNGQRLPIVLLQSPGNPDLGPERVREHEFGFDVNAFASRLGLEVTWYRRRTNGMIVGESGPPGRGFILVNLGLVTQHGFEAQVRGRIIDRSALRWDVALLHSEYSSKLVDLGKANPILSAEGGWQEGYPLGVRFEQFPILGGEDLNGDGILAADELRRGDIDNPAYRGLSLPPRSQTVTTTVGLFEARLRLSAVLERKAGFTQVNRFFCNRENCREAVDRSTRIEEQLKVHRRFARNFEKGDFTRLREVSIALDLPAHLTSRIGVSRATLVGSARNLALWSAFSGPDPEGGVSPQVVGIPSVAGGYIEGNIPQSRTFALRLDLGF